MSGNAEGECIHELSKKFNVYDQAVDIVSCFESFFRHSYGSIFDDFHFERFPEISNGGNTYTPDFTTVINDDYGIVGEVKRTFPEDEVPFQRELEQIENYDDSYDLQSGNGNRQVPTTTDILLIISGSSAPQVGARIQELIDNSELNLDRNLVVLRYQYNDTDVLSRYEFQRVNTVDEEFRDDCLHRDIALSSELGPSGNYGTLSVYPKHFKPEKVKKPICNDQPPETYLATILWHKVFPEYLGKSDYQEWAAGSAQRTITITDSVSGFTDTFDDYMNDGSVRQSWISDALSFLQDANLATRSGKDYTIKFRGLVRDVGSDNVQDGTTELDQIDTLGEKFIKRYCHYTTSDSENLQDY